MDDKIPDFKPCQIVNEEAGITEYIFEDAFYTAVPVVDGVYHTCDWMVGRDGRLIGIQFWAIHPPLTK